MIPFASSPGGKGRRGSARWAVTLVILVLLAIAGHFLYTKFQENQTSARADAVEATTDESTDTAQADGANPQAEPTPSSKSPRVNEMESISNIRSEQH